MHKAHDKLVPGSSKSRYNPAAKLQSYYVFVCLQVRVYNWFANRRKEDAFRHKLAHDNMQQVHGYRFLRKSKKKNKSSLHLRHYAEACNEWRDSSPRYSAGVTQLRKNVTTVASRGRH